VDRSGRRRTGIYTVEGGREEGGGGGEEHERVRKRAEASSRGGEGEGEDGRRKKRTLLRGFGWL